MKKGGAQKNPSPYRARDPVDGQPASEAEALDAAFRGRSGIPAERLLLAIRFVIGRSRAWGVRKVWAFVRHVCGWIVSRRRIWRLMKAHGLVSPASAPERREAAPRGHVAVPESNRRWATDLATQATARDGVVAIVPVIDCGDRAVLAIELTRSQEAPEPPRVLRRLVQLSLLVHFPQLVTAPVAAGGDARS